MSTQLVASQTGDTRTFNSDSAQNAEGLTDIIFNGGVLPSNLALSSIQLEMTNNVKTTDKPVVVMVAPRQILANREADLITKNNNEQRIRKKIEKVHFQ